MWQTLIVLILVLLVLAAWIAVLHAVDRKARSVLRGDWSAFWVWQIDRLYMRLLQRPGYEGLENIPTGAKPGPIIFIVNHTAAIDPALVQAALPFEVRWIMMREMNVGPVVWLSRFLGTIIVEQDGRDLGPVREAIRHVRAGGVLGIFPEGGIERPPGRIRPFQEGAGFIVARCRAPVIPVWISGTPGGGSSLSSLYKFGRARVVFGEPLDFSDERDAAAITQALRRCIARMSGWPLSDEAVGTEANLIIEPAP